MRNNLARDAGFILVGAIAGGVIAALTTPYSGRRMRRMVRHKIEDGSEELMQAAEGLRDQYDQLYVRGREFATAAQKMARRVA